MAGALILVFDYVTMNLFTLGGFSPIEWPNVIQAWLDGFFCSCLYAMVRPRLGPGPRTAVIVGTAIYFVKHGLTFIWIAARTPPQYPLALSVLLPWAKFIAATYLAGWQYIEKAP